MPFLHIVNNDNNLNQTYFASSGYAAMIEKAYLMMSFVKMSICLQRCIWYVLDG